MTQNEYSQLEESSSIGSNQTSKAFEKLEVELEQEKDGRREERFLWVLTLVMLIDIFLLGTMSNWTAPLVVGAIQVFGLLVLARKCGVDEVQVWLDKVLNVVGKNSD